MILLNWQFWVADLKKGFKICVLLSECLNLIFLNTFKPSADRDEHNHNDSKLNLLVIICHKSSIGFKQKKYLENLRRKFH